MTRHCSLHTLAATPATARAGLVSSVGKQELLLARLSAPGCPANGIVAKRLALAVAGDDG